MAALSKSRRRLLDRLTGAPLPAAESRNASLANRVQLTLIEKNMRNPN
jgi:hypothetical protein